MSNEIERKFLIKEMPDISNLKSLSYERYFLFRNPSVEIRIQKKGDKYEFERKTTESNLSAKKYKFELTKEEFEKLKKQSNESIIRESYKISETPEITIKIYQGKFEGLKRIEVEFSDEKEAQEFHPLEWFGKEITNSSLGRDSKLIDLSDEEIKNFLNEDN